MCTCMGTLTEVKEFFVQYCQGTLGLRKELWTTWTGA